MAEGLTKGEKLDLIEQEEARVRELREVTIKNSLNQVEQGLKRLESVLSHMDQELQKLKQGEEE